MRVVIQIGYLKSAGRRREGQLIRAWVDEVECSWQDDVGRYITSRADAAKGTLWYLWQGDVEDDGVIRVEVKTFLKGVGPDEGRTFESLYYLNAEAPVREIEVRGVGQRGYPLLKGRLVEMGTVSKQDEREADIEEFLRGEF